MTTLEVLLPLSMFVALLALLMSGFPVAFTLAGTALAFALVGHCVDLFFLTDLGFIPAKIFGVISNFTLLAVPLFIFMGVMLEKSGLAEELIEAMGQLCRRVRGGMLISVILVGALLAATTGIVGATVVTMGVLSLPTLLSRGYDKRLACGTIAASGTLGQIIPPSIVLILLGDLMNVDVGDLFTGALVPGLLLVALYILYVLAVAYLRPSQVPAPLVDSELPSVGKVLAALLPPALLVLLVLGSILFGVASPTESAACGALGAILLTAAKRRLTYSTLNATMDQTAQMTAMVFTILIGAQFFGTVFRGLAGDEVIAAGIGALDVGPHWILVAMMAFLFVLGFFLDFIEICFIVIPILAPHLFALGFDPLWLAILCAVNLQTSFLTPPFGFALFYLKGVAPAGVSTGDIYRGVVPFIIIQLLGLLLVALFPMLATWLPRHAF